MKTQLKLELTEEQTDALIPLFEAVSKLNTAIIGTTSAASIIGQPFMDDATGLVVVKFKVLNPGEAKRVADALGTPYRISCNG